MTLPPSPAEPGFRLKLQALIASLQNIEASLDEGMGQNGGPDGVHLSQEARKSLADASEKLGEMAHAPEGGSTGQDEATAGVRPAGQEGLERELVRLASFPELNANPILELSLQGQILYANPSALRLFPDLSSLGIRHPYLSGWEEAVQAVCKGLVSSISREVQADEKTYQQSVVYVKEFNCLRVYGLDVTDRCQAEEELRASEARLRALMDEAPVAIALSRESKFLYVNPAYRAMHGISSDAELIGHPIYEQVAPESQEKSRERADRRLHGLPVDTSYEFIAVRQDGTRIPVLAAVTRVNLADGPATIGFFQDITERKQMEEALRQSEEQYRRIIESTNEGVWIVDRETHTTFVNRQMAEMLGYSPEEMVGKKSVELMDEEDKARVPEMLKRREQGIAEAFEHRFIRKDGTTLWCISNAVPLLDQDGQFNGSLGLLTDISDRKKREIELHALNRTLRAISASNQAMMRAASEDDFMAAVCRIIIEDCGHAMVWIGLAEQDKDRSVRPVASAGFEDGYLKTLQLTWADTERGRGPTGTAIRSGEPAISRNIRTDPQFGPWRAEAIQRGYASSIALPLPSEGGAFGALTIHSREPDPFSEDEVALLSELASDLSYGIQTLRLRRANEEAQAALKASAEKYRSLFNGMTEGFALHEIICDENGAPCDYRFLEINPAFERLTGLKQEDVVGKLYSQVLPGDDPNWVKIYGQVALSGEPVHFENYSPALKQHYEVFAYRPAPGQFAVIFLNITQRKEIEIALRQAHDELELRVDERTEELEVANEELKVEIDERLQAEEVIRQNAARAGTLAEVSRRLSASNLEEKAVLDTVTQAASQTLGEACVAWLLSEDGSQLIPESLYHPDRPVRDALRQALAVRLAIRDGGIGQVVQTGKPLFAPQPAPAQIEMLFRSGYQTQVYSAEVNSLMIVPVAVEGKTAGALVLTRHRADHLYVEDDFKFFQSLADRAGIAIANVRLYHNLEKALRQEQTLRRQLIQAEKNLALNRMVASVAHEINNPIQTIVNCLYLLRTAVPPESPEREALDMATSETRRIAGLVQQLRDLYRPGQDKSMRPLEVKEILEEVHKLLLPHLQHHHVAWEAQDIPTGVVFNGIPDHIKQVFLNICLNAVDAMEPDGGQISVKTMLDTQLRQVGIAITDTGPGIPTEYLDNIFEPFFTTKTTGTGLGLAITFDIVQSHGGRITVESQPGSGATFTVWLPVL